MTEANAALDEIGSTMREALLNWPAQIAGLKRHAMVDTDGRGLTLNNHPAGIQDRDGAPPLIRASRRRWPLVKLAFMDSGYAGECVATATAIRVEIVRKPKDQVGFAVHARRWVVERFFA